MKKSLGVLVMALVACSSVAPAAQRKIQDPTPPPYVPGNMRVATQSSLTPQFPMQRPDDDGMRPQGLQRGLTIARNKEIKQDTDLLLQLAGELKKSVDASITGDMLSLQAIKKTDEIEKLAKRVRGKMKQTYSEASGTNR